MLAGVIEHFLDNVTEREFAVPFMALLRARRFTEVHYLHGQYEFGKDFVGQASDGDQRTQYVFQSKAGDLNLADWGKGRPQLDILRTNTLAHPGFDPTLRRRAVLVMTGRLVGAAALEAQNYQQQVAASGSSLEVWDREALVASILDAFEIGVAGRTDGPLFALIGSIDEGSATDAALERFSRRWIAGGASPWAAILEAAVVSERVTSRDRLDQACNVALGVIRAAWARGHGARPPAPALQEMANLGRLLFRTYASSLWSRGAPSLPDAETLVRDHDEPAGYVTYPVRCIKYVEAISLLGLSPELSGAEAIPSATEIPRHVAECVRNHPGCAHPVSDRWAVSIVPIALTFAQLGEIGLLGEYLLAITKWLADRYDKGHRGLANPTAEPLEEVEYLLANAFPAAERRVRRSESYIATVVLDVAALFDLRDVYRTARNEFLAVGALPCVLESRDDESQYRIDDPSLSFEPNAPYADERPDDLTAVAPHYPRQLPRRYLQEISRSWDHLAVSAFLRDRHFLSAITDLKA